MRESDVCLHHQRGSFRKNVISLDAEDSKLGVYFASKELYLLHLNKSHGWKPSSTLIVKRDTWVFTGETWVGSNIRGSIFFFWKNKICSNILKKKWQETSALHRQTPKIAASNSTYTMRTKKRKFRMWLVWNTTHLKLHSRLYLFFVSPYVGRILSCFFWSSRYSLCVLYRSFQSFFTI
jgi:hypothetical protein